MKNIANLLLGFFLLTSIILFTACVPTIEPQNPNIGGGTIETTPTPESTVQDLKTEINFTAGEDALVIMLDAATFADDITIGDFTFSGANAGALQSSTLERKTDTVLFISASSAFQTSKESVTLANRGLKTSSEDASLNTFSTTKIIATPTEKQETFTPVADAVMLSIRLKKGGVFDENVSLSEDFVFSGPNVEKFTSGTLVRESDTLVRISINQTNQASIINALTRTTTTRSVDSVTIKETALTVGTDTIDIFAGAAAKDVAQTVEFNSVATSLRIDLGENEAFSPKLSASDFIIPQMEIRDSDIFRIGENAIVINLPKHSLVGNVDVTIKETAFDVLPQSIEMRLSVGVAAHVAAGSNSIVVTLKDAVLPDTVVMGDTYELMFVDPENEDVLTLLYYAGGITTTRSSDTQFVITTTEKLPKDDIVYIYIDLPSGTLHGATITSSYDETVTPPTEITSLMPMAGQASKFNDVYVFLFGNAFKAPVDKSLFTFTGENANILSEGIFSLVAKADIPAEILNEIVEAEQYYGVLTNCIKIETGDFDIVAENDFVTVDTSALTGLGFFGMLAIPAPDAVTDVSTTFTANESGNVFTVTLNDGEFVDRDITYQDFRFTSNYNYQPKVQKISATQIRLIMSGDGLSAGEEVSITFDYSVFKTKCTGFTITPDLPITTTFSSETPVDIFSVILQNGTFISQEEMDTYESLFFSLSHSSHGFSQSFTPTRISDTEVVFTTSTTMIGTMTLSIPSVFVVGDSATVTIESFGPVQKEIIVNDYAYSVDVKLTNGTFATELHDSSFSLGDGVHNYSSTIRRISDTHAIVYIMYGVFTPNDGTVLNVAHSAFFKRPDDITVEPIYNPYLTEYYNNGKGHNAFVISLENGKFFNKMRDFDIEVFFVEGSSANRHDFTVVRNSDTQLTVTLLNEEMLTDYTRVDITLHALEEYATGFTITSSYVAP